MGANWRHMMRRAGCACCDDQTFASRRSFLLGGAALATATSGLLGASGADAQTSVSPPRGGDYIIRGGYVVTMESGVEDLLVGDVHVRNGAIAAIGPSINAPGAEIIDASRMIVMPGFVETHSHIWNSLLRNMRRPGIDYVQLKNIFGKHHTPADFYRANRLFMTEALNAGVTSVINYAHNTLTPAHCDAEIRAMGESGLRGRYAFGGADPTPLDKLTDHDDVLRIKKQWFGQGSTIADRVDLGFAIRAPGALPKVYKEEFKFAKDNGLPMILHSGWVGVQAHPAQLQDEGLLDKNTIFVHSYMYDARDHEVMIKTGASNSFSIYSELRGSTGLEYRVQMLDMVRSGVNICLSFDATSLNPTSTFEQMRLFFNVAAKIPNSLNEKVNVTQTQCLEMATINGAKAMGLGDKTGSLKVGKRADIILVRGDELNMVPLVDARSALVHSAHAGNVDTVIVDGKVLKFGGKILSVDVEKVKQEAIESMFDLRKRAGDRWTPKPNERPT